MNEEVYICSQYIYQSNRKRPVHRFGSWAMGFENPQAIYKWISGKSLPSLDNFLILSRLLHASIEDILVVDGDIVMSALFETIEDAVSESGELAYVISLLKGFY